MKRLLGAAIVAAMFGALVWVVSLTTGALFKALVITLGAWAIGLFLALVVIPILVWCFE